MVLLEYKEVYVIDSMDGRFPNRKLMQSMIKPKNKLFTITIFI